MTGLLFSMCPACQGDWHAQPTWGCPGSLATDDEIAKFHSPPIGFDELVSPPPSRPRIRFWANDAAKNGLRMVEGTLQVGNVEVAYRNGLTEYTITGNMLPPVLQVLVPGEATEEPQPVVAPEDDFIGAEISYGLEGFEPVGTIQPDDLKIESEADYAVHSWGGQRVRRVKTREDMTVEFSTAMVAPGVMERFFGP